MKPLFNNYRLEPRQKLLERASREQMLTVLFKATKLSAAATASSIIEYILQNKLLFFPVFVLKNGTLILTTVSCNTTQSQE